MKQLDRRGMTLIELMVSISISAVIGVMIAVTFSTAQQTVSVGVAGAQAFDTARVIENAIREDLSKFTTDGVLVIKTQTIQNPDTDKRYEVDQLLFFTQDEYQSWQYVNGDSDNPKITANNAAIWYGHTLQKQYDGGSLVPSSILGDDSDAPKWDGLLPFEALDTSAEYERSMVLGRHVTLLTKTRTDPNHNDTQWHENNDNNTLNVWGTQIALGENRYEPGDLYELSVRDIVYTDIDTIKNKIVYDGFDEDGDGTQDFKRFNNVSKRYSFDTIPPFIQNLVSRRHSRSDYDHTIGTNSNGREAQKVLLNTQLGLHCSRFKIEFWNDSDPSAPFWQRPTDNPGAISPIGSITYLMAGLGQDSEQMTLVRSGDSKHEYYPASDYRYDATRISLPKMLRFTITVHDANGRLNKMHHESREFVPKGDANAGDPRPGHTSDGRTVQFIVRIPRKNGSSVGSSYGGFGSSSPNGNVRDRQPSNDLFGSKSNGGVPAGNF